MKPTPHKVRIKGKDHQVQIDAAGRFTVRVVGWVPAGTHTNRFGAHKTAGGVSIITYRQRSLWQLQRSIDGLRTDSKH